MDSSTCLNCGKPIYYGPRGTTRPNDCSKRDIIWRHLDTEHHKCAGRVPVATPIMERNYAAEDAHGRHRDPEVLQRGAPR